MTYAHSQALIATPIGMVRLSGDGSVLTRINIESGTAREIAAADPLLAEAAAQLRAYFTAGLTDFDVPLAPPASPRGQVLRDAIRSVSYGDTLGYGALARQAGSGPRAVGQACARNPFPIIIPCHRILAAGGQLGAYSAGDGPITKAWLIAHEQKKGARK